MYLRWILLALLGSALAGCNQGIPVRWTDEMGQSPDMPLADAWKAARESPVNVAMELDRDSESLIWPKTVEEAMDLESRGYTAANGIGTNYMYGVRAEHYRWQYMDAAKPAKISYVEDLRLSDESLGELPSPLISFDKMRPLCVQPAPDEGISPDWQCDAHDDNKIVVSRPDSRMVPMRIDVLLMAWGDYNHDGVEDVMLHLIYHTSGTAVYDRLAFLTRSGPDEPLLIIEPFLPVEAGGRISGE